MSAAPSTPRYAIVSFAHEQAGIVAQGFTSVEAFHRLFLTPYGMGGERYHPGEGWTVHGTLVATDGSTVVAVPIVTWRGNDGAVRYLCQATDDGSPPAISAYALSESDLVLNLTGQL